jgi:hypothetical protein
MIERLFLRHPRSVGESYLEHQAVALSFAGELLLAGLVCAIHAAVPALFTTTASRAVERLHQRLVLGRGRHRGEATRAASAPSLFGRASDRLGGFDPVI